MDLATKYQLIEKIVQTTDDAVLEEIQAVLESREADHPIPAHHRQILDQRLAEDDANPQAGEDWETVLSRIGKQL